MLLLPTGGIAMFVSISRRSVQSQEALGQGQGQAFQPVLGLPNQVHQLDLMQAEASASATAASQSSFM